MVAIAGDWWQVVASAGDGCLHVPIVGFLVNPSFDPLDHSLLLPSAEHGAHAAIRDIAAPDADGDSIGLLGGNLSASSS